MMERSTTCFNHLVSPIEGGNLVVDLDKNDYKKNIEELKNSVVGEGFSHPTIMELKEKLASLSGLNSFKLVPMGGGHFHVLLNSIEE